MEVVYQISKKEKLDRKKYMGVWMLQSREMTVRIRMFPSKVTT